LNEISTKGTGNSTGVCGGRAYIEFKNIGTSGRLDADAVPSLGNVRLSSGTLNNIVLTTSLSVLFEGDLVVFCTVDIDDKSILELTLFGRAGILKKEITLVGVGNETQSFQRRSDGSYSYAIPTPGEENVFQAGPSDASVQGDPHFKTWRGQHYDFMGECDLVFIHSKDFESGLGLDVHIRTKMRRDMSYISSVVLRIGSDVLEVASQGLYFLNGVANAELPSEFSGFEFLHTQPTDTQHIFEVYLGGRERIKLKTFKDFVSVLIEQGKSEHFLNSVGLMGDFGEGRRFGRDGQTVLDDANAFGQEWQVLDTDPKLFQTVRFPQHPQKCTMPTLKTTGILRRRLMETSSVDELAAEKACEHWGEQGKDDCVFDVLTTGDIEMAVAGAY
jgi:hypothetical protein